MTRYQEAEGPLETPCWQWTGAINGRGYGSVNFRGWRGNAHRYFFEHLVERVPAELMVLHRCDVRACVNPDHLFIGTAKDNTADMDAKGRRRTVAPRGRDNHTNKLSEEQVREIRRLEGSGEYQHDIAKRFGVSSSLIRAIWTRRVWAWL